MHSACIHHEIFVCTVRTGTKGNGIHAQNLPFPWDYCVIPNLSCYRTNEGYERWIGCQHYLPLYSTWEVSPRYQHTMADYLSWLIAKDWPTHGERIPHFLQLKRKNLLQFMRTFVVVNWFSHTFVGTTLFPKANYSKSSEKIIPLRGTFWEYTFTDLLFHVYVYVGSYKAQMLPAGSKVPGYISITSWSLNTRQLSRNTVKEPTFISHSFLSRYDSTMITKIKRNCNFNKSQLSS